MNELLEDILSNRFIQEHFLWYALVSFVLCFICCMSLLLFTERKKHISCSLLSEYIFLVLCFTVICRKKGELEQFFPIPFYNYGHQKLGLLWSDMLLNILMFIPIGALIKLSFMKLKWYYVVLLGFLLSVLIEAFQWTFKCGSCETNDIINNTFGTIVGFYLCKQIYARI